MSAFSDSVEGQWYTRPHWLLLFAPLSALFILLAYLRRRRIQGSPVPTVSIPVIVVGNIAVGGTGKTPVILALVHHLIENGFRPGVISRGYGANPKLIQSLLVSPESETKAFGDEPLLISRLAGCPVVVGPNRVESVQYITTNTQCDIILSDDGLQHYNLGRSVEIAVIDSERRIGNGWRLPVGPLRESPKRLQEVDFTLVNGPKFSASWLPQKHTYFMTIKPKIWCNVKTGETASLGELNIQKASAIAGIGNPKRFFDSLKKMGFLGSSQAFPDHHPFTISDFVDIGDTMLLMTEKDAVKCRSFAKDNWWALSIEMVIDDVFFDQLLACIQPLQPQNNQS